MSATQMNVRIDSETKGAGDSVFAKIGYSPTQVVRVIWEYAAKSKRNPEAVEKLLDETARVADPSIEQRIESGLRAAERGLEIYPKVLEQFGLDALPQGELSDAERLEKARFERAVERGRITPAEETSGQVKLTDRDALWRTIAEEVMGE